ncbi:MAG: AI-2E family transporter [Candidatus Absconditabacteria bacterium]|nr:AI-2E family transporter [Candidatus Absconditabacteria bacterium]MDD3868035.1 AI-2E family transporter [Candidatus Absconditabacteria bacterium]MDD4714282.1 AI-2E family transporter [Candidatus Absconditabacteria bacterium]
MLKKVKEQSQKTKLELRGNVDARKARVNKRWDKKFPKPSMDLPSDHLVVEKQALEERKVFNSKRMFIFWGIALLMVFVGYIFFNNLSMIFMVVAAFIMSLALEGLVLFFQRLIKSRGLSILISYLLLILFLLSGFFIIIPFLLSWGSQILQMGISALQGIHSEILTLGIDGYINQISRLPEFFKENLLQYINKTSSATLLQSISDNLGNIINTSSGYLKILGNYAMNFFGGIFSFVFNLVILFTLCVFFSLSHYDVKYAGKYLLRNIKNSKQKIDDVYGGISAWLKSQFLLCVFIGIASLLGLSLLEIIGISIPQKGELALLAGLFEIIPYLGPWLGAIPAVLLALVSAGRKGVLAVGILYICIQQFEEKILVPVVMNKTLGLNPLLVFLSMLFGGLIMGFYGVVLAVPLAVILSIVFKVPEKGEDEFSEEPKKPLSTKTSKTPKKK